MKAPAHHARPVFVDGTGRRRRVVKLAGGALGGVLLVGLVLLIVALSGGPTLHVPGFSDAGGPAEDSNSAPDVPATGAPSESQSPTSAAGPGPSDAGQPTPDPTNPRRIPTQTPSHQPKPTKT